MSNNYIFLKGFLKKIIVNRIMVHKLINLGFGPLLLDLFPEYLPASLAKREKLRYYSYISLIKELNDILTNNHINYVLIKTIMPFKYLSNDIDILVTDASQYSIFIKALKENGYKILHMSPSEVRFKKRKYEQRIDIYSSIVYLGLNLKWLTRSIINEKVKFSLIEKCSLYIPNLANELVLNAFHALLGHNSISLFDKIYCLSILDTLSKNFLIFNNIIDNIRNKSWPEYCAFIILEYLSFSLFNKNLLKSYSSMFSYAFLRDPDINTYQKTLHLFKYIESFPINYVRNISYRVRESKMKSFFQHSLFLWNLIVRNKHGYPQT